MRKQSVKIADILDLVVADYQAHGQSSLIDVRGHLKKLMAHFGERVATLIHTSHINDYKRKRLAEGASVATVHRELSVLRRAYNLAIEDELIDRMPRIKTPKSEEADPRTGYFEHEEFLAFQKAARAIRTNRRDNGKLLADIYDLAYSSGWRLKEVMGVSKDMVRLEDRILVLPKSKHKNRKPKIFPLEGELWHMIANRLQTANAEGFLFHRHGKRVKSIGVLARTVCERAGIGHKTFHDLRRSTRTNLGRAGVDDQTGMRIMGHTTVSVYHDYNQISLDQLRGAVRKVSEHLESKTVKNLTKSDRSLQRVQPEELRAVTDDIGSVIAVSKAESEPAPGTGSVSMLAKVKVYLAQMWQVATKKEKK